jgi:hypothetical protein
MRTHSAQSLSRLKDFSDQMDVSPDEPECPSGERSKRIQDHFCYRELDIAGAQPLNLQRRFGILKRFLIDVFSCSVVDLSSGSLDNAEYQH